MWGAMKKGASAHFSRQQEQFCSSLKDFDDSGQGWGEIGDREDSSKVGWGKPNYASSQPPIRGWGANNSGSALRGWGSSQAPAPAHATETDRDPAAVRLPETNGWGSSQPSSRTAEVPKEIRQAGSQDARLSLAPTPTSNGSLYPSFEATRQQLPIDPGTGSTRTKPLTNGFASTGIPEANATSTGSIRSKPCANAANPSMPTTSANISEKPTSNTASSRTRTNKSQGPYVPPEAKLVATDSVAPVTFTSSSPRMGRAPAQRQATTPSTRSSLFALKTNPAPTREASVETASASSTSPPENAGLATNKREDMFIVAQSETDRFKEVILLLKNNPHQRPALLIVDRSRTDSVFLSAILCLSGLRASATSVQKIADQASICVMGTDELKANVISAQMVLNVDMVDAFDQLGERMKFLAKSGLMRTILVPAKDSIRAANLALMFRDCGLHVPRQLECFLPRDNQ